MHQEVGERTWYLRKFRRCPECSIEAMKAINFFSNNFCVFFLLDQSEATSGSSKWQVPITPIIMKSCDATVSGLSKRFPMRSDTSDKVYLMSLAHSGLEETALVCLSKARSDLIGYARLSL